MSSQELQQVGSALEGIRKVLGAVYAHTLADADVGVKAEHLSRCEFSNTEIAKLLGTTANAINVALHRARKERPRSTGKSKPRA